MYCETRTGRFAGNLDEMLGCRTSGFSHACAFSEKEIARYFIRKMDSTGIYLLTVSLIDNSGSPESDNLLVSVMGNDDKAAARLADDLEARLGIKMTRTIVSSYGLSKSRRVNANESRSPGQPSYLG